MIDLTFDVDDLVLDDLVVTSMRDTVALPESGASAQTSCSGSSSCCCCTTQPVQPPGM